jgi:transposase-like protein
MAKFMGINKHNLQVYTKTFEFIHNIRRKANRRKIYFIFQSIPPRSICINNRQT